VAATGAAARLGGERWQVEHVSDLDVWAAVRKSPDGKHIRVLVARDPASLRRELAEQAAILADVNRQDR
jgi:hypothetical protein